MNTLIALTLLLPFLAATWIGLTWLHGVNRGEMGEKHTARVANGAVLLALLLILVMDGMALVEGVPGQVVLAPWFVSGQFQILISFTLDTLALVMATLVATVAFLTLRFSVNYMHREAGFQRFFIILCLFTASMLLIVTAGNAVLAFVGWELAGLSSYLLIGYAVERSTATKNATRAFVTNRIGDAGFILAIAFALFWWQSVEWPDIIAGITGLESLAAGVLAGGFLLAALAKSAQVPFAPWISRALEGPTPSSAIFYGSLMVHAGVYLVIRLQPLWEHIPALMVLLAVLGAATALYGFISGLVQTDVKSSLMFSTTAQTGLMLLACGLGWFTLAAWYLVLHALWRAYQFLHAPAVMHLVSRPARPVPQWLQRCPALFTAALQRFWLDHMADWLCVRPLKIMARDVQAFDEQVVNRLVGLPHSAGAISSLADWEARQQGQHVEGDTGNIGKGSGLAGGFLEWIASLLHWFEEHLVLRGGGEGLLNLMRHLGGYVALLDDLLSRPRYLLVMVAVTFVVIL